MTFWRSFLMGLARLMDIGGTMGVELPQHSDAEALASDWQAVGDDLRLAMLEFEKETLI